MNNYTVIKQYLGIAEGARNRRKSTEKYNEIPLKRQCLSF